MCVIIIIMTFIIIAVVVAQFTAAKLHYVRVHREPCIYARTYSGISHYDARIHT